MTNVGLYFSGFLGAVLSALIPLVNSELVLLSLTTLPETKAGILGCALIVTAGQAVGTVILYWLARKATRWHPSRRRAAVIERWRSKFEGAPRSVASVLFVSAVTGIPPYYVTTVLSGSLHIGFARFMAVVTVGRLVRFTVIAFFPRLVLGVWNLF
ncbi:MAG: VTT domain-containing protein [Vicinamibacterales bacterium]